MKLKTKVRAGLGQLRNMASLSGTVSNHNARRLVVKSKVRSGVAGGWDANNNARKIVVKSKVRAGGIWENHSGRKLIVKSKVKSGLAGTEYQHNARKLVVRTKVRSGAGGSGGWEGSNHSPRKLVAK